jgi:hypothetical protein
METGLRQDASGATVPHRIVNRFAAAIDGKPVIEAELFRAVAANPYIRFFIQPAKSGSLAFEWTEETGRRATASAAFTVA